MADNVFAYLGDDILNSTLQDFSQLINTHFLSQVNNDPRLKSRLEKFSHRSDRWPDEVVKAFRNRENPVYNRNKWLRLTNPTLTTQI